MYAVSTTHARSTTANGIWRCVADAPAYMPQPPQPAPRWCFICETMVSGPTFAHHLGHHAASADTALPRVDAKPTKMRLACFVCGKTFARYRMWETHENTCFAASRLKVKFIRAKPQICDVPPRLTTVDSGKECVAALMRLSAAYDPPVSRLFFGVTLDAKSAKLAPLFVGLRVPKINVTQAYSNFPRGRSSRTSLTVLVSNPQGCESVKCSVKVGGNVR